MKKITAFLLTLLALVFVFPVLFLAVGSLMGKNELTDLLLPVLKTGSTGYASWKLFPEYPQFDATVPMEMLNFFPGLKFKKVVGVLTEVKGLPFAEEAVRLGPDFMDAYEDPLIHRQNEQI